jgi:hypothetical protein
VDGDSPPATGKQVGWTLWREVYGTVIGTLPFIIGIMVAWMSMSERVRVLEVNHDAYKNTVAVEHAALRATMETRDRQIDRDREQIIKALDRISTQIEVMQQQVGNAARRG